MSTLFANSFLTDLFEQIKVNTFKIILMRSGFRFNRATHKLYANVAASELSTQFGYTAGGATLTGVAVSQNDTLNCGEFSANNVNWNVSGGALTTSGAIIYNDDGEDDPIVGYIDFNGDQTTLDGGTATIANILLQLRG